MADTGRGRRRGSGRCKCGSQFTGSTPADRCRTSSWSLCCSISAEVCRGSVTVSMISKFGNLSVGGGGGETDTGVEAGSASGEVDDVFIAWMQSIRCACKKSR